MGGITKRPQCQIINGIRIPSFFSPKCFNEVLNYKPTRDDTFVVTYPKCGTTWMQNIVMYIFRKGQELGQQEDFRILSPFIDKLGTEGIAKMPRPGAMKTHLPFSHIPYSADAKYIYVVRNPKDCCVSFYYHTRNNLGFGYWYAEFNDFFELFLAGETEYNDYFDHLMSWYPHLNDPNIFFTKYEDLKKNTKDIVIKLAKFLGKEYIDSIEHDNNILNNILKFSSFEYMKAQTLIQEFGKSDPKQSSTFGKSDPKQSSTFEKDFEGARYAEEFVKSLKIPEDGPKLEFMRKGIVGDWKNHFSDDQSKRLDQKFLDKTKGT
ncbi:Sulfotransferase 1C2, partial [Stegodyphus mimosarum]